MKVRILTAVNKNNPNILLLLRILIVTIFVWNPCDGRDDCPQRSDIGSMIGNSCSNQEFAEDECNYNYVWRPTVYNDGATTNICTEPYECQPILTCRCNGDIWEPCTASKLTPCDNDDVNEIVYSTCSPDDNEMVRNDPTDNNNEDGSGTNNNHNNMNNNDENANDNRNNNSNNINNNTNNNNIPEESNSINQERDTSVTCPVESPSGNNIAAAATTCNNNTSLECRYRYIWMPTIVQDPNDFSHTICSGPYTCMATEFCDCWENQWNCRVFNLESCTTTNQNTDEDANIQPFSSCIPPSSPPISSTSSSSSNPDMNDTDEIQNNITIVSNNNNELYTNSSSNNNHTNPNNNSLAEEHDTTGNRTNMDPSSVCPLEPPGRNSQATCNTTTTWNNDNLLGCEYRHQWIPTITQDPNDSSSYICSSPYTCAATEFCYCSEEDQWLCKVYDVYECDIINNTMEDGNIQPFSSCLVPPTTTTSSSNDTITTLATERNIVRNYLRYGW